MVDEELTNAAAISSRIWYTRTQEHSQYMSAKAAQHYVDVNYFHTNFIRTWHLPDDQWNRGLNYLIHARTGKLWTKARESKAIYTLLLLNLKIAAFFAITKSPSTPRRS